MTTTINVTARPSVRAALRWKRTSDDPKGPSFRTRKVKARGDKVKVVWNKSDGSSESITIG